MWPVLSVWTFLGEWRNNRDFLLLEAFFSPLFWLDPIYYLRTVVPFSRDLPT